jgi:glycosyltransferase involved in cell wall biosynthesis
LVFITINDISKIGGLSRAAFNLYELFKEKGIKVKIITGHLDENNEKYFKFAKEDIINLDLGSVHKISSSKAKLLRWYYEYYKALKKLNIEDTTIISIETIINFLTIASLGSKNKIIATEHTSFKRKLFTRLLKRVLYPKAHKLVVLTETDKRLYEKVGVKNAIVIPNFITNSEKISKLNNKNILFVANLERVKGIDYLVRIIKKFNDREWKFTIVGDGSLRKNLEQELKKYNVEIKGKSLNIEEEFLNADVFIMTSRKEGFPFVLLEAKNHGLPIVSFDIPTGPREMIEDGKNGFLIKFENVDLFVRKLRLLTKNEPLLKEMAKHSKESARRYTKEEIGEKWFRII